MSLVRNLRKNEEESRNLDSTGRIDILNKLILDCVIGTIVFTINYIIVVATEHKALGSPNRYKYVRKH